MKIAVMHVNSSSYSSTSPTMRIARYVAERLNVPLIHDQQTARQHANTRFDVLLVKYGMLKFSNHRDEAVKIHENARHVINLENDYTFVPDKRFRKADETWSTVEGKTRLVNWNILTRHHVNSWQSKQAIAEPTREGLVYYGAHRPDRVSSFERYFRNPQYPLTVSTFRGGAAFRQYGVTDVIGAFRDPDAQAQWQATIYIEDETSHKLYTSPATRFYECVMCGLLQFVDYKAKGTLEMAGIKVPEKYVVYDARELLLHLRHWRKLRREQHNRWFKDYGIELHKQFDFAAKHIGETNAIPTRRTVRRSNRTG